MRTIGDLLDRARAPRRGAAVGTSGTINTLVGDGAGGARRGRRAASTAPPCATTARSTRLRRRMLAVDARARAELPGHGHEARRPDARRRGAGRRRILARGRAPSSPRAPGRSARASCSSWRGVRRPRRGARGSAGGARSRRSRTATPATTRTAAGRALALTLFDGVAPRLRLPPLVARAARVRGAPARHRACGRPRPPPPPHVLPHPERRAARLRARGDRADRARRARPPQAESRSSATRAAAACAQRNVGSCAALPHCYESPTRSTGPTSVWLSACSSAKRRRPARSCTWTPAAENAELELWAAERRVDLLSRLLDRPVVIAAGRDPRARELRRRALLKSRARKLRDSCLRRPASVSGPPDHRRGHRRLGQVDAAPAARALARRAGLPRALHRVELVAAGAPVDEARQEEGPAHADDLQPAARRRLRRSAHLQDHPAAQGGHDRARRPLRLHRVRRATWRAACIREWVRAVYSFAPRPGPGALLPRADRGVARSACSPAARSSSTTRPAWTSGSPTDPVESFRLFQSRVLDIYDELTAEFGLRVDRRDRRHPDPAEDRPPRWCDRMLRGYDGPERRSSRCAAAGGAKRSKSWYGHGLPYVKIGSAARAT